MGAFLGQFGEAAAHLPRALVRLDEAALAANECCGIWQITHSVRPKIHKDVRRNAYCCRAASSNETSTQNSGRGPGTAAPRWMSWSLQAKGLVEPGMGRFINAHLDFTRSRRGRPRRRRRRRRHRLAGTSSAFKRKVLTRRITEGDLACDRLIDGPFASPRFLPRPLPVLPFFTTPRSPLSKRCFLSSAPT